MDLEISEGKNVRPSISLVHGVSLIANNISVNNLYEQLFRYDIYHKNVN